MKNYSIAEIVRTFSIEVDKPEDEDQDHIHFDFVVMIAKVSAKEYALQVYRLETVEVKNLDGEYSHEEMLVRDEFLLEDDETRFESEAEAESFLKERLADMFD